MAIDGRAQLRINSQGWMGRMPAAHPPRPHSSRLTVIFASTRDLRDVSAVLFRY